VLIQADRSIIPACDVALPRFIEIVQATGDLDAVGAYKIGAALGLSVGLKAVVQAARDYTNKPLIYDHQKAGTDIPDTADEFMGVLREAGITAVILFPLSGPDTQLAWTNAAKAAGLAVIVGGHMTHSRFLASRGGYIVDDATKRIYEQAATQDIYDFVVPGNQPDVIQTIREFLTERRPADAQVPIFYAPGFIAQGGRLSDAARAAGPRWHAIIGRNIYEAGDIRRAAIEYGRAVA
jgi:orotidine-5'-phosphate decarboxylase